MISLKKLDKRMLGFNDFKYAIEFSRPNDVLKFAEYRKWYTDNCGPTIEYDLWDTCSVYRNPSWSWIRGVYNNSYRCRILIADEQDVVSAKLTWGLH